MTANRVIDSHLDLSGVGNLTHNAIDLLLSGTTFLVVSSSSPLPPAARIAIAGAGITIVDEGPGGGLIFTSTATGSTGSFDAAGHAALRQLIHLADGGGPFEGFASGVVRDSGPLPFPTASIWYVDATKTKKIVEQIATYNGNRSLATVQWKAYDVNGTTVLSTVTDMISYTGAFESSRSRIIG